MVKLRGGGGGKTSDKLWRVRRVCELSGGRGGGLFYECFVTASQVQLSVRLCFLRCYTAPIRCVAPALY